ncbi:MAG TPA: redoxin domain-containing protein, partial [Pirellulales bacterium]|nr:redoxin domain-containing protein [Pirellulales bacterium]
MEGVSVVGVNPNDDDSPADVERFRRQYHVEFPIVKDVGHRLTDHFGATRQLEIFLIDADRHVRYHGRVDDQYTPGNHRPAPLRSDLLEAIADLSAGRPVAVAETPFAGCSIQRSHAPTAAGVTYRQVAGVFERHCVECHRPGQVGPFSLTNYQDAAAWSSTIRERVADGTMPPWHADPGIGHFANDRRLSDEEKRLLLAWVDSGAAEGEPLSPRPEREAVARWGIGEPDKIVTMPRPFAVPATGIVDYVTLDIDLGLTEDRWVSATEILPGNRTLLHHAQAVIGPPGKAKEIAAGQGEFWHFADFAPGLAPSVLPEGLARLAPAGWHLYLTMHYVTTGLAASDQTSIGMKFTDRPSIAVYTHNILTDQFSIPPHEPALRVEQSWTVPSDILVLAFFPHMHLRGKSFRYEAIYPDGRREPLLSVPRYDFMWQHRYVLAEPKTVPAGTVIRAVAVYDNSAANPANPDPSATVHYGQQSSDEMFNGYVDFAIVSSPPPPPLQLLAVAVCGIWLVDRRWRRKRDRSPVAEA